MFGATFETFFFFDESVSTIKVTTERAAVIRNAVALIWDEISMADKHSVECADRLCREIMRFEDPDLEHVPFGGKLMIFAGDWRQLFPVVVRGGRAQVVNACMKRSILWNESSAFNGKTNLVDFQFFLFLCPFWRFMAI